MEQPCGCDRLNEEAERSSCEKDEEEKFFVNTERKVQASTEKLKKSRALIS